MSATKRYSEHIFIAFITHIVNDRLDIIQHSQYRNNLCCNSKCNARKATGDFFCSSCDIKFQLFKYVSLFSHLHSVK